MKNNIEILHSYNVNIVSLLLQAVLFSIFLYFLYKVVLYINLKIKLNRTQQATRIEVIYQKLFVLYLQTHSYEFEQKEIIVNRINNISTNCEFNKILRKSLYQFIKNLQGSYKEKMEELYYKLDVYYK